jgi:hypothetical protein
LTIVGSAVQEEGKYTLRDLKRQRPQAGLLFNILTNLHKFLAFENRDPFAARQQVSPCGVVSVYTSVCRTHDMPIWERALDVESLLCRMRVIVGAGTTCTG